MTGETGRPADGLVSELVLVRLRSNVDDTERSRVAARLATLGGEVLVSARWGWVARLPQLAKPQLATERAVATVGGVQPSGRPLPRIRVPVSDV